MTSHSLIIHHALLWPRYALCVVPHCVCVCVAVHCQCILVQPPVLHGFVDIVYLTKVSYDALRTRYILSRYVFMYVTWWHWELSASRTTQNIHIFIMIRNAQTIKTFSLWAVGTSCLSCLTDTFKLLLVVVLLLFYLIYRPQNYSAYMRLTIKHILWHRV